MNIAFVGVRAAFAVALFTFILTTILLGTGCATQAGGSGRVGTPHRRILAQGDLRGRQAERMPLRIQVVGNHKVGVVTLMDGARTITSVSPGEIRVLYVNWQWREHNPRVMLGIQKPGRPIVVVPFQFRLWWQDDYVHANTPIQTEVLTLVDEGTPATSVPGTSGPSSGGPGFIRLR